MLPHSPLHCKQRLGAGEVAQPSRLEPCCSVRRDARGRPAYIVALDWRITHIVLGALVALKIAFLFALAWNTRFVMDEFVQLGWAKYLGDGLFDTIWHAKAVGYAVFFKIAHIIGWDATSILLVGRLQTALLACATLGMVYATARRLGEDRLRALLILVVLLSFSNFMERIFRTRAEPLAVFFAAAALLVVLRGQADRARTLIAAGILSGFAFLATQKAVYFNVALGVALLADAALARRFLVGIVRGSWLVLGWLMPVSVYCLVFGGTDPLAIARHLLFGPLEVTMHGAEAYSGLRSYVIQTLTRNAMLYALCFAGMALALVRITSLNERRRIALVFSLVIAALVFAHDQPWPYVFVMALPFIVLWLPVPFDLFAEDRRVHALLWVTLAAAVVLSFVKTLRYLNHDNRDQLELVERAESLLAPNELYFDGVAMLPNRREPSTLWLDRLYVLKTLREGRQSEAYNVFANTPPKIILWSYRMESVYPVVAPLIRDSYVQVAPNLRIAGRLLRAGEPTTFVVPVTARYALYGPTGRRQDGEVEVDGTLLEPPFRLEKGRKSVILWAGPSAVLLLPQSAYAGRIASGADNKRLFADVYSK